MTKKEIASLLIGTVFLLLVVFTVISSFIGIIPFISSKGMYEYMGLFLIAAALCFSYFTFSFFSPRDGLPEKLAVAVRIAATILSILFIVIGIFLTKLFKSELVKRSVSPDKSYELIADYQKSDEVWNVNVYKRHPLGIKTIEDSSRIYDMAEVDGKIDVQWNADGCSISYEAYEYEQDEAKLVSEIFYFKSR